MLNNPEREPNKDQSDYLDGEGDGFIPELPITPDYLVRDDSDNETSSSPDPVVTADEQSSEKIKRPPSLRIKKTHKTFCSGKSPKCGDKTYKLPGRLTKNTFSPSLTKCNVCRNTWS